MKLCFLPANRAWAFVLGDSLVSVEFHGVQRFLFARREEAVEAATARGLKVDRNGNVS